MDEREVEHRATTNANALEAVLERCDVAFGDSHVRRQASSTVRGLIGEQLVQSDLVPSICELMTASRRASVRVTMSVFARCLRVPCRRPKAACAFGKPGSCRRLKGSVRGVGGATSAKAFGYPWAGTR